MRALQYLNTSTITSVSGSPVPMPSVRIRLPGSEPSTGANAAENELDGGNHFGDALRSVGDGNRLAVDILKREHAVEGSLTSFKYCAGGHHLKEELWRPVCLGRRFGCGRGVDARECASGAYGYEHDGNDTPC